MGKKKDKKFSRGIEKIEYSSRKKRISFSRKVTRIRLQEISISVNQTIVPILLRNPFFPPRWGFEKRSINNFIAKSKQVLWVKVKS